MKTKYLDKRSWRRLIRKKYKEIVVQDEQFQGIIGEITMEKVKSPLVVNIIGEDIVVADDGYRWLQILPENRHYSMTVMYNRDDEPIQYYIDINALNIIEPGQARTHDLYLDVLVLPDGRYELVDEQDAKRALNKKEITKHQYDFAYETAHKVMDYVKTNFSEIRKLAEYCKEKIEQ
ncbi:DUF402 domain-containing protein [Macrococcoides caseolyticum]|uniref:DUF402 domain-containing protein n=1 Tax=Macrococcoides caseolyticum TaxID=69966 RepID=UPI001F292FF1|nr:DUF402 domain-containing protein [Macrococcus caseolyticus]MCE4955940.1 DUF402 domain-containing protein [Macrococcus caseolyticus]